MVNQMAATLNLRTGAAPTNCDDKERGAVVAECILPSDWMRENSTSTESISGNGTDETENTEAL